MIHTQRQIDRLKRMISDLGLLVESRVRDSIEAIRKRDEAGAQKVIAGDGDIDAAEVEVEEECLKTLALHQPVAFDLRYVVSVLKINNELERMGDLAVNIAEQAVFLARKPPVGAAPYDLDGMAERVQEMIRRSLSSLLGIDPSEAEAVRELDDAVDQIHRGMYDLVEDVIRLHPERTEQMIHLLNISRQLERIADHASNIAKDVLYLARGEIVRHRKAQQMRDARDAAARAAQNGAQQS